MGDTAEMMLDGTLCEQCGEYLGEPCGYPTLCTGCRQEELDDFDEEEASR